MKETILQACRKTPGKYCQLTTPQILRIWGSYELLCEWVVENKLTLAGNQITA